MSKEHHVIYVPGLHDQHPINKNLTRFVPLFWKPYGFQGHIVAPHWEEGKEFAPKLKRILAKIDELADQGHIVSLIGQSAGGSAVMNAYSERRNMINGVVDVTGRLREGENVSPSLEVAARSSPAFAESVLLFERKNEPTLSNQDRKKIMTIRPFWDEVVPATTVPLEGATNLVAPIPEHSIGGIAMCTIFAKRILYFLNNLAY